MIFDETSGAPNSRVVVIAFKVFLRAPIPIYLMGIMQLRLGNPAVTHLKSPSVIRSAVRRHLRVQCSSFITHTPSHAASNVGNSDVEAGMHPQTGTVSDLITPLVFSLSED